MRQGQTEKEDKPERKRKEKNFFNGSKQREVRQILGMASYQDLWLFFFFPFFPAVKEG
jgi:hypothetical protein